MRTYTIDAATEEEKQATEAIIQRIGLREKLEMRHAREGQSCPLEVACIVKNTPEAVNPTKGFVGCLSIYVDESKPEILVNDCTNTGELKGLRWYVFEGVMVFVHLAKPDTSA